MGDESSTCRGNPRPGAHGGVKEVDREKQDIKLRHCVQMEGRNSRIITLYHDFRFDHELLKFRHILDFAWV